MIRADSLTKFYERRCVVNNLSFSIADREIVGFLGLNGAGKTTVLRMLAGLLAPSSGKIEIDGADLLEDPLSMRWRIGFLPERPPLYDDMTVQGYLRFAARLRGMDEQAVDKRVHDTLDTTALKEYVDAPVATLSHGFRQRLGIAQAIVHDPALVILDEPINGLDPVQIVEMRTLIRSLKDRHTVLVSSHILPEISQTCDRFLIINSGELVGEGTEAELATKVGGRRELWVTVAGGRAEVEAALKSAGAVRSVEILNETGGIVEAQIALERDAAEEVARAVVSAGLGLKRLEPKRSELESMFLRLTGANPS
jgi:ABC-2 type transport system ATP-binding protein